MLKYALLAGAMTIAAPALAQTQPVPADPATSTGTQQAPQTTMPAQDPAVTPADPAATPAQTAPADSATAPSTQAAAPASKAEQVAQVVETEFPTYDKDANGSLSSAEFGSWMVALKTASDPATKADSAATKKWISQAFASADTDKSKSVSKTELAGFLSKG